MPIEDEVLQDKPVQLKGVDTTGSDVFEKHYGDLKKNYRTRDLTPKTSEEYFGKNIQTYGTEITTGNIGGASSVDYELLNGLYAPVNISEGIPDQFERAQYLDRYGDKMIQLATPDTFAVRFENDLIGLNAYNEKKYPLAVKKFIDDLDENQGIAAEMFNIAGALVGKTAVALTGVIPLFYGIGSSIINGDMSKIFDNSAFDAWEYMDNSLSENFVVYGGSDIYDFDPETGEFKQKNFFGRVWNDPIKSLSSDIVPAAAFIGGAVLGEMGFAKIPKVGGITKGISTVPALGTSWFSKSVRVARGLDKLDDFAAMRRVASHRKFFEGGLKTIGTAVRTSGYESALIARSTQQNTLNNLIEAHYQNFGTEPTDYELGRYQEEANQAGESAFMLNVPLVAGSTFLQFPRLFGRNWALHRTGAGILNKYKLGKTRIVDYKRVANADASNYLKYLGYTKATLGRGITEGWEEFAQGAMEEGLMDYYTYPFQKDTMGEKVSFLHAMSKAGFNYANSQEGLDSVAIGALMGLLGMPLPGKINSDGSISGGFQWHGGIAEGIRETRNKIKTAREQANQMNSSNEMLANNFQEFTKQRKIQGEQDDFAMVNDTYNFKNKEHESLMNYVMARHNNGIEDTIDQDLEALESMPLDQFNKQFGAKDVVEFTEESKREAIKNARERVADTIKSINDIDTILADNPNLMDGFSKHLSGKYGQKIAGIDQVNFQRMFREYLIYLDSAGKNADSRKDALLKEINETTNGSLTATLFENAQEIITGINPEADTIAEAVEFSDQAVGLDNEGVLMNSIMQKWKEKDPKSYNKNSKKLEKKIEDVIKLGGRSSRAAALFNSLFTKKGFQSLGDFTAELQQLAHAELRRVAEKLAEEEMKLNPNSHSKAELNADSMFGKENAARIKRAKDTLEELKKVKRFSDSMDDTVPFEERQEALLKQLDKNPALFKTIKDNLENREDNPIDLTGVATVAELKTLGDDTINAVLDELELMLTNFKDVSEALEEFIESGGPLPPNQTGEQIPANIISGEQDIESGFKEGSRTAPVGMILVTPDKNIKTVGNTEHSRPSDHIAKKDEGWQENGQYSLNNALINASEFLRNKDLSEGTHEVIFRVKENQDKEYLNDSNQTIINTYYIDSNTGEEIFIGRLPAYNLNQDGSPKEMSYLAELRKDIVEREKLLKETTGEDSQEVNVAEQVVNTINKIKDIDSKIEKAKIEEDNESQQSNTADEIRNYLTEQTKETAEEELFPLLYNIISEGLELAAATPESIIDYAIKNELLIEVEEEGTKKYKFNQENQANKREFWIEALKDVRAFDIGAEILHRNGFNIDSGIIDFSEPQIEDYSGKEFTVAKLKEIAKEKGITIPSKARKAEIIDLLREYDKSQETETTEDSKSKIEELSKEKEELLSALSSLQEAMPEDLKPDLEEETEVFGVLADIEEAEFSEIESNIEDAQKRAEEKFNTEELEKAKIIDEKFEDIVKAIIKSKINLFFEGDTSVEANHRKC